MSLIMVGRFLYIKRLFDEVSELEGDIVECGVGRGNTFHFWAILCHDSTKLRRLWGFDSFEGIPEPTLEDVSPRNLKKGEIGRGTLKGVLAMLVHSGLSPGWVRSRVTLVRGFFDESLSKYTGEQIALLHIDVDLYESYKIVLEMLYDKVVPGGIIMFDEYMGTIEHEHFPGAKKAVDEFFADLDVRIERDVAFGKYYLVKP